MISNHDEKLKTEYIVANRYRLIQKVGSGSFGKIYSAYDITTGEKVAIKMEKSQSKHLQLCFESKVYRILQSYAGIPAMKDYIEENDYNSLVIELLGPSLEKLFDKCKRKFNLKTVLMLALQIIDRLELLHSRCFIHRDVKPDNFLIGTGRLCHRLYLIDFGLAKKYKSSTTGVHIPYRDDKSLTGTARYASSNTHMGIEQSRRDDMESLGYMLLYFLRGNLPWQGLQASNKKEKYRKIGEMKVSTSIESLCRGFPNEFVLYFKYCRSLDFEKKPDYNYLRKIFKLLFKKMGYVDDDLYLWFFVPDEE
ncbi:casein kinase I-like [Octopus sinensis]|uniref:non-specific serine/threonine protein kinase n=1 Tax=Octopus sinensis TaxID=2607531 RepID=A0A6P7TS20_9MOLL|nr:casein kinase I-like [Octopus sinensis]